MLSCQGDKLPHEFDVTRLRQSERTSETQNDTTETHSEIIQNN